MSNKIKVLYKRVGQDPTIIEIENTLEAKQKLVGGFIEIVPYGDHELICNEEGKIMGLYPNVGFDYDIINGNFIIANDDYETGDFASLTEDEIEHIKEDLKNRSFHYTKTQMKAVLNQEKDLMKQYGDFKEKEIDDELEKLYEDLENDIEQEPTEEDLDEMEKDFNLSHAVDDLLTPDVYFEPDFEEKQKKDLENRKEKVDEIKKSFGENYGAKDKAEVKENVENYYSTKFDKNFNLKERGER